MAFFFYSLPLFLKPKITLIYVIDFLNVIEDFTFILVIVILLVWAYCFRLIMLFSLLGIPHIFVSLIDKFDKHNIINKTPMFLFLDAGKNIGVEQCYNTNTLLLG